MTQLIQKLGCILSITIAFMFVGATADAAQRKPRPAKPRPTPATRPVPKPSSEPEVKLERLPPDPDVEAADIAITANIKAKSLVFEVVPNPTVEFPGTPERNTIWEAKRENLPTPVEPGVTYRDIGIRLKITSVFKDIDRIVAEALGEIPVSDDSKPASATAIAQLPSDKIQPPTNSPARQRSPQRKRR
jgi:hypothetical protein